MQSLNNKLFTTVKNENGICTHSFQNIGHCLCAIPLPNHFHPYNVQAVVIHIHQFLLLPTDV